MTASGPVVLPDLPGPLGAEASRRLWLAKDAGDAAARRRLIEHNLRLAVFVARRHHGRLPVQDAVQECFAGLVKAVDMYDVRRGVAFSAYASIWMRNRLQRAAEDDEAFIRVPQGQRTLRKAIREADSAAGTAPPAGALARKLGCSDADVRRLRAALRAPAALDGPAWGSPDAPALRDVLPAEDSIEDVALRAGAARQAREMLATLPRRDAQVLAWRFGLGGGPPLTLQEIGGRLGVTKQRVRQIEQAALKGLRRSASG